MSDLNHRARKILNAIVHEYLATGDAVGSRTVTRRGVLFADEVGARFV